METRKEMVREMEIKVVNEMEMGTGRETEMGKEMVRELEMGWEMEMDREIGEEYGDEDGDGKFWLSATAAAVSYLPEAASAAHKTRDFQRQSPPLPHVMYLPASKTLRTGPYKS
jgi:hypothetical protein